MATVENKPDLETKLDPAAQAALDLATTGRLTINPDDPPYAQELIKGMNILLASFERLEAAVTNLGTTMNRTVEWEEVAGAGDVVHDMQDRMTQMHISDE